MRMNIYPWDCLCIHICVCRCMFVCVCARTYTHTNKHNHTHKYSLSVSSSLLFTALLPLFLHTHAHTVSFPPSFSRPFLSFSVKHILTRTLTITQHTLVLSRTHTRANIYATYSTSPSISTFIYLCHTSISINLSHLNIHRWMVWVVLATRVHLPNMFQYIYIYNIRYYTEICCLNIYIPTYMYSYLNMYVYLYIYVCMYIYIYRDTYTYIYIYIWIYIHVCRYIDM